MARLPSLKIAHKLPLALIGNALMVGLGIGVAAYFVSLDTVQTQREHNFEASVQSGIGRLQDYIKGVGADLRLFSARPETVTSLTAMGAALGAERPRALRPVPDVPMPRAIGA